MLMQVQVLNTVPCPSQAAKLHATNSRLSMEVQITQTHRLGLVTAQRALLLLASPPPKTQGNAVGRMCTDTAALMSQRRTAAPLLS